MKTLQENLIDLELENRELKQKLEELKEDRKTVYDTACELVEYLENTDHIDLEQIDLYIASIQNFSN